MASPPPLRFRQAHEDDIGRLLDIQLGAFPDSRSFEARKRHLQQRIFGDFGDLYVAAHGSQLLAQAFVYPIQGWFGGRRVPLGGIASVAVAAEARGRGVARALLEHVHEVSRARGDALTLLYAFRHGFYRRLGYAAVTPMVRLEVAPSAIPEAWVTAARGAFRILDRDDREALVQMYERAALRATGWLQRRPLAWERWLLDDRRAWFITNDRRGYVSWSLEQSEDHAATHLVVRDVVAEDDATWRLIWGLLGAQKDQIHAIDVSVTHDDPAVHALVDVDANRFGTERVEHPLGTVYAGPMVRVHGVATALEARGYAADGELVVGVAGHESYALEVRGGTPRATVTDAPCDLLFSDAAILSSVLYGAVRPSQLTRTGLVTARDGGSLAQADLLLALPAFHALDPF
ncbi:GNAT family N-acetyltransferase [Pendulispora rubella]|uniref:GNAT family N-acetyltransferase n=1 Tax=Pendulispora rubella TaxID=2741070 RepID=A0ABZ2L4G3_9BACT